MSSISRFSSPQGNNDVMALQAKAHEYKLPCHYDPVGRKFTVVVRSTEDLPHVDEIRNLAEKMDWSIGGDSLSAAALETKTLDVVSLPGAIPSSYVFQKDPKGYSTDQNKYKADFGEAVLTGQRLVGEGHELTSILDELAKIRHEMAKTSGTEDWENFGKMRTIHDGLMDTPLAGNAYKSYGVAIGDQIRNAIPLGKKEVDIRFPDYGGRKCVMQVKVYDREPITLEEWRSINKKMKLGLNPKELSNSNEASYLVLDKLITNGRQKLIELREKHPIEYGKILPSLCMQLFGSRVSMQRDDAHLYLGRLPMVMGTLRLELEPGKPYAMSRFLTFTETPSLNPPIDLIHMDVFVKEAAMKAASTAFAKVVNWDGKDERELKENMGEMLYILSHATSWERGTAAILEMVEDACFRHHGMSIERNPEKSMNLEALTHDIGSFVQSYANGEFVTVIRHLPS